MEQYFGDLRPTVSEEPKSRNAERFIKRRTFVGVRCNVFPALCVSALNNRLPLRPLRFGVEDGSDSASKPPASLPEVIFLQHRVPFPPATKLAPRAHNEPGNP